MIELLSLTPFMIFLLGAALLPLIPQGSPRALLSLLIPVASAYMIWVTPDGIIGQVSLAGWELSLLRMDGLSRIFGLIFSLAAFLALLYAWHLRDTVQQIATLLYAGAAIGATFAGDLLSLFIFWEATAIASVFLIWARRTEGAYWTGLRYLVIQVGSGVILLAGIILHYRETGSLAFEAMTLMSPASYAIFLAFGIKCAFPLLHNWLQDAYPAATVTGTVVLSAFTTKMAIYALARGFAGTEILVYIGAVMAVFPIFYAIVENDLRKVLAYSLNNQLGYMVVGIGIGTPLALNGTAAHAVVHILYKALLFMSVGAVLFRTGTAKATDLGGLWKSMPVTAIFCMIGGASIAAMPLFAGFVTKSVLLSATIYEGHYIVWGMLLFAAAGALHYCAIKVPYYAFFGKDSGLRPKEAPWNMLLAMGLAAILCVFIGAYPAPLYALLPFEIDYQPYTFDHVLTQLQLLVFAALIFALDLRFGYSVRPKQSITIDFDWTYRKFGPALIRALRTLIRGTWGHTIAQANYQFTRTLRNLEGAHGPTGVFARAWPTGTMVLWIAVLFGGTLLLSFI